MWDSSTTNKWIDNPDLRAQVTSEIKLPHRLIAKLSLLGQNCQDSGYLIFIKSMLFVYWPPSAFQKRFGTTLSLDIYPILKKRKQPWVFGEKKIEHCPQTQTKESCQLAVKINFKLCKNKGKHWHLSSKKKYIPLIPLHYLLTLREICYDRI